MAATGAVVKAVVGKGPVLPLSPPWWASAASGIVFTCGVVLAFRGLGYLLRPENRELKDRALFGSAGAGYGFSLMILAVLPLLLHAGPVQHGSAPCPLCPCSQCEPTAPPKRAGAGKIRALTPLTNIGEDRRREGGNVAPNEVINLRSELAGDGAQPGDVLLLLGSSDCIPTRPGPKGQWKDNDELAAARTHWVRQDLNDGKIQFQEFALPHAPCGRTTNVRAVYPYLFTIQQAGSPGAGGN